MQKTQETEKQDINIVQNQDIIEKIQTKFNLGFELKEEVKQKMGIKLQNKLYINQEYEFQWPDINAIEDNGEGFCRGLRNQMAILVD